MWWLLAFVSAALLGCYDSAKKISLKGNAVIPVLFLNTALSALIFSPFLFSTGFGGWEVQKYILLKSALVLASWMAGYFAMKHLPLTIVGPVNATRPVLVLLGAIFLFGERLNLLQWIGVGLAVVAYVMLRVSGKKEGIGTGDKWIICMILAVILGAASGLYDKYLMSPEHLGLDRRQVLSWYTFYQAIMMAVVTGFMWYPVNKTENPVFHPTPFHWNWAIPLISIFLCGADYVYMEALSKPEALIAVVSMIRRGSVLVSFAIGALLLHEKNLKSKALDLCLLLLSMVFLYLGSR
jgi:drug/metabolite transporter (DMT)-like permease